MMQIRHLQTPQPLESIEKSMKHKNQYYTVWLSVTDGICGVLKNTSEAQHAKREKASNLQQ